MNTKTQGNIKCTVSQCKHHETDCNCCSLNSISVGTHELNPTQCECIDCLSFEVK